VMDLRGFHLVEQILARLEQILDGRDMGFKRQGRGVWGRSVEPWILETRRGRTGDRQGRHGHWTRRDGRGGNNGGGCGRQSSASHERGTLWFILFFFLI
jgi:hypothetical protein